MQAIVNEILHRIIHKPVAGDPVFPCKKRACNANAKVGPEALGIGAGMARMGGAFVNNLELAGTQAGPQLFFNTGDMDWQRSGGRRGHGSGFDMFVQENRLRKYENQH